MLLEVDSAVYVMSITKTKILLKLSDVSTVTDNIKTPQFFLFLTSKPKFDPLFLQRRKMVVSPYPQPASGLETKVKKK